MHRFIPALLLALVPSVASAQRDAKVPDPDPEIERKSFILPPGFEVNLYAADPLLAKPIQMNFDPQGRLWVASSEVYPQIKPGEKANDKIIILEDTTGSGRADKTTVFADGLLIPTGVAPGDGGAYVANSTELVHLSASKPGGKADRKRILLSGFGTEDTHHIIHTFRWGPDGCLYFNQSIYIHSHVETPHGVKRLNAGGIWRFRPETTELDVFARGWINPWGHAFDKWGQSFATDGANGEGINHVVPGGYYPTAQGPNVQRILHGLNPGSPKHCGLEILSGRHLPDDWQGDMITCDFRGHRVCRFKVQDDGSTFASREMPELIKSSHPAFRPIDVKMGPDGAIYIADWYNPIIQHGEVDFRDPRRDKTHGRIWRVTAKNRPLVPKPKLADATVPELLEALKAPEDWTRQQAKRVLKERGAEQLLPALSAWISKLDLKEPGFGHHRLEALWVYQSLNVSPHLANAVLLAVLDSPDATARAAACRIVGVWARKLEQDAALFKSLREGVNTEGGKKFDVTVNWRLATAPALLTRMIYDPHPRVRLEAVRALAQIPSAKVAEIALRVLDPVYVDDVPLGKLTDDTILDSEKMYQHLRKHEKRADRPLDRTLDYALWLTVRELEPYWMPAFKEGRLTFGGDAKKLAFALNAVGSKDVVKPVLALLEEGKVPKENRPGLWLLLARTGGTEELGRVFIPGLREAKSNPEEVEALLVAMEANVRERKTGTPPGEEHEELTEFAHHVRPAARQAALRLMGLWKMEEYRTQLEQRAANAEKEVGDRQAALEALVSLGGSSTRDYVKGLTTDEHPPLTRRLAVVAFTGVDLPAAAAAAADVLAAATPADELADVFAAFLSRKGGAQALTKALAGKKLPPDVAKLGLRVVRAAVTQNDGGLSDALTKAGGLSAMKKEATAAEVKAAVADVAALGDPARGEQVFRRKELQCLACHGIGGAGGQVGPDLTSIGASAPADYLVESILLPNKAVKEGFHALRVVTVDDKVHLGVKVRETPAELVLRTPEDKEVSIPVKDIAEKGNTRSLMPDGLADTLTKQEFADLVRFLSELGKVGPYAPSKARVVRRWQVIEPTRDNLELFRRNRVAAATEPDNRFVWSPVYSRASGDLPLAELPKAMVWQNTDPLTVLRFQLDATAGGAVKLRFNSVAGQTLYHGTNPVEVKPETVLDLKPGVQTLTLVIDRTKRTDDVRAELDDVPGSPARATVVGGK
jgi:putative heme-binding domain-containing protein